MIHQTLHAALTMLLLGEDVTQTKWAVDKGEVEM